MRWREIQREGPERKIQREEEIEKCRKRGTNRKRDGNIGVKTGKQKQRQK